jgi:hypothetical protein
VVAGGLSGRRRGPPEEENQDKEDMEKFIDGELDLVRVPPIAVTCLSTKAHIYPISVLDEEGGQSLSQSLSQSRPVYRRTSSSTGWTRRAA